MAEGIAAVLRVIIPVTSDIATAFGWAGARVAKVVDDAITLSCDPRSVVRGHCVHPVADSALVGIATVEEFVPPIVFQCRVKIVDNILAVDGDITLITQTFRAAGEIIRHQMISGGRLEIVTRPPSQSTVVGLPQPTRPVIPSRLFALLAGVPEIEWPPKDWPERSPRATPTQVLVSRDEEVARTIHREARLVTDCKLWRVLSVALVDALFGARHEYGFVE